MVQHIHPYREREFVDRSGEDDAVPHELHRDRLRHLEYVPARPLSSELRVGTVLEHAGADVELAVEPLQWWRQRRAAGLLLIRQVWLPDGRQAIRQHRSANRCAQDGGREMRFGITGVIVAWLTAAAFTLMFASQFDMRRPEFVIAYWVVPVGVDVVLITMLLFRRRVRDSLAASPATERLAMSAGLWLSAVLAPFVVWRAITAAAAAFEIVPEEQSRFVATAIFALTPTLLLGLLAAATAMLLRPGAHRASHREPQRDPSRVH